jgi:hypothetical protein
LSQAELRHAQRQAEIERRQGELTQLQKAENKMISSNRIFVEHVIRLVKIFMIGKKRFSNELEMSIFPGRC